MTKLPSTPKPPKILPFDHQCPATLKIAVKSPVLSKQYRCTTEQRAGTTPLVFQTTGGSSHLLQNTGQPLVLRATDIWRKRKCCITQGCQMCNMEIKWAGLNAADIWLGSTTPQLFYTRLMIKRVGGPVRNATSCTGVQDNHFGVFNSQKFHYTHHSPAHTVQTPVHNDVK